MRVQLICIIFCMLLTGCTTTASVSNFPKSNSSINFVKISERNLNPDDPIWNLKGRSEYFISLNFEDEKSLFELLLKANQNQGFSTYYSDIHNNVIIGKRGLRMNEWNSVSGIYFKKVLDIYQIYIRVDITQDITGGWKENRAKKIADEICNMSKKCI